MASANAAPAELKPEAWIVEDAPTVESGTTSPQATVAGNPQDGTWRLDDVLSGRGGHTIVRDTRANRLLLFGGVSERGFDPLVWEHDLSEPSGWKPLQISGPGPVGREEHAAAFDSIGNRMIVFGGVRRDAFLSDLWVLELDDVPVWKAIPLSEPNPGARVASSVAFDSRTRRLLLFGGGISIDVFRNWQIAGDLWALSLGSLQWERVAELDDRIGARIGSGFVIDDSERRILLHAGRTKGASHSDLWSRPLDRSGGWEPIAIVGELSARSNHVAVWVPGSESRPPHVVLFGGIWTNTGTDGTWSLSLGEHPTLSRIVSPGSDPGVRSSPAAWFDPIGSRIMLHGGERYAAASGTDLWQLDLGPAPFWKLLEAPSDARPRPRHSLGMVYDPLRERALIMGGEYGDFADYCRAGGGLTRLADVWAVPGAASDTWEPLPATNSRTPTAGHAVVVDSRRDRLLMFGGQTEYVWCSSGHEQIEVTLRNDVWTAPLNGLQPWSPLAVQGAAPPPRSFASAAYDARHDRLLVWGSWPLWRGPAQNDLWGLDLSTLTWAPLGQEQPRPPLAHFSLVLDSLRDRVLVVGGGDNAQIRAEVWALPLGPGGAWTKLPVSGGPALNSSASALTLLVLDPTRDRLVSAVAGAEGTELWVLPLNGDLLWKRLSPAGPVPPARYRSAMVYDEARDQLTLSNGGIGFGLADDLWHLVWGEPFVSVALDVRPGEAADRLNPRSRGVLPVAILGSTKCDVSVLELSSLRLAGAEIRVVGNGNSSAVLKDVNGDGMTDLVAHFELRQMTLSPEQTTLELVGRTRDGGRIGGRVSVQIDPATGLASNVEAARGLIGARPRPEELTLRPSGGIDRSAGQVELGLPTAAAVKLEVFDPLGRRFSSATLVLEPGWHEVPVPGGSELRSGLYFVRASVLGRILTTRALVLR